MEGQTPSSNNKGQETIVFISYAREDAEKARRLYQDLKNAGLNPWLDKKELLPGQNWQNEIEDAISKSRYFIPVFSKTSVMKIGYVQNEFKFALEVFRSYPPDAIFYIPVRLDDCEIPYRELRSIHHADLFPNWDYGVRKVLEAMKIKTQDKNMVRQLDISQDILLSKSFKDTSQTEQTNRS